MDRVGRNSRLVLAAGLYVTVAPDFRRVSDVRPAYGYRGLSDPYVHDLSPKDTGIFRIDLETGKQKCFPWPISFSGGISRRMAGRYSFAVQSRRTQCCHRFAPRRQRQAIVPDRHQWDSQQIAEPVYSPAYACYVLQNENEIIQYS